MKKAAEKEQTGSRESASSGSNSPSRPASKIKSQKSNDSNTSDGSLNIPQNMNNLISLNRTISNESRGSRKGLGSRHVSRCGPYDDIPEEEEFQSSAVRFANHSTLSTSQTSSYQGHSSSASNIGNIGILSGNVGNLSGREKLDEILDEKENKELIIRNMSRTSSKSIDIDNPGPFLQNEKRDNFEITMNERTSSLTLNQELNIEFGEITSQNSQTSSSVGGVGGKGSSSQTSTSAINNRPSSANLTSPINSFEKMPLNRSRSSSSSQNHNLIYRINSLGSSQNPLERVKSSGSNPLDQKISSLNSNISQNSKISLERGEESRETHSILISSASENTNAFLNKCDPSTDTNSLDHDQKTVITKITKMNKTQSLCLDTNLDAKFEFERNLTRNMSLQVEEGRKNKHIKKVMVRKLNFVDMVSTTDLEYLRDSIENSKATSANNNSSTNNSNNSSSHNIPIRTIS